MNAHLGLRLSGLARELAKHQAEEGLNGRQRKADGVGDEEIRVVDGECVDGPERA